MLPSDHPQHNYIVYMHTVPPSFFPHHSLVAFFIKKIIYFQRNNNRIFFKARYDCNLQE